MVKEEHGFIFYIWAKVEAKEYSNTRKEEAPKFALDSMMLVFLGLWYQDET